MCAGHVFRPQNKQRVWLIETRVRYSGHNGEWGANLRVDTFYDDAAPCPLKTEDGAIRLAKAINWRSTHSAG